MITDRQQPTAVRTWSSSVTSERLLCKCRVPGLMITSSTNCRYSTLRDNNQYHGLHTDTHTQIHRHRYTDRQSQMINEHTCTHTCDASTHRAWLVCLNLSPQPDDSVTPVTRLHTDGGVLYVSAVSLLRTAVSPTAYRQCTSTVHISC